MRTPGPWFVHDFSELGGEVTVSCDHPATITVATMDRALTAELGERQANARLIAAAPDLLDACRKAAMWLEGWASAEPYLSVLRAAIAKAETRQ